MHEMIEVCCPPIELFRESLVSEIVIQLSSHKHLTLVSQRRYMDLNVNRGDCNEGVARTDSY